MQRGLLIALLCFSFIVLGFMIVRFFAQPTTEESISGNSIAAPGHETDTIEASAPDTPAVQRSSNSGMSDAAVDAVHTAGVKTSPYYCTPEDRVIVDCAESPQRVICGWYFTSDAYCTGKDPCVKFFVNECEACADEAIEYWTDGDCPLHV